MSYRLRSLRGLGSETADGLENQDQMSAALASIEHSDDSEPEEGSDEIVVLAPLALEARAVRTGAPWADVRRIGARHERCARPIAQFPNLIRTSAKSSTSTPGGDSSRAETDIGVSPPSSQFIK